MNSAVTIHRLLIYSSLLFWPLNAAASVSLPATSSTASQPARSSQPIAQAQFAAQRFAADTAPALTLPGIPRLPIELFARRPELSQPQLSPDGHFLSVVMEDTHSGEHDLAIYDIQNDSPKLRSLLRMPRRQVPLHMLWSSSSELVIEKGESDGSLDAPKYLGEVVSTDINGRHSRYIYGYERDRTRYVGAASDQIDRGWGRVIAVHHPVDGHFAMAVTEWDRRDHTDVYDVDSVSGHRSLLTGLDLGMAQFMTDHQGMPLFGYGIDRDYHYQVYRRSSEQWLLLDPKLAGANLMPLALDPGTDRLYASLSLHGGTSALIEQDLDGGHRHRLAQDAYSDIARIEWTAQPSQPFAVIFAAGKPKPMLLPSQGRDAQLYQQLLKLYPGMDVHFIDFSEDGSQLLFSLSSDRQPDVYMLLNTQTGKTHLLFSSRPWIHSAQMAERRPRQFMLSDRVVVEAMLTLPADYRRHPLPAVLLPHGGPFYVSDRWDYDSDAQFLANRGYLVIQVNFRGSSGYGQRFTNAGVRHWGDRVQQDMIEVVQQLIAEGSVDPHRVCSYGGSFGGYSALMSAIRAPGLFKCAIGYAGVYDLAMMYHKGDIQDSHQGRSYLHIAIGDDDASLLANSPVHLADQLKLPILLIHGKDDQRAPFAQAKAMRAALDAAGHPPEWLAIADEGHGFYQQAHNLTRLQTIAAFLDRYLAPPAATASTAAQPATASSGQP